MKRTVDDSFISDSRANDTLSSNPEHHELSHSLSESQAGSGNSVDGGLVFENSSADNNLTGSTTPGLYSTILEQNVATSSDVSEDDALDDSLNHEAFDTPDTPVVTFETEQEKRGSIRRVSMVNFMVGISMIPRIYYESLTI